MSESFCVNISGTVLSLLMYENIRAQFDQEGFLLGEIVTREKQTITDNDQQVLNIEHTIKINSVLPFPDRGEKLYNNAGKINEDRIKNLLDKNIVSWYKFKHNNSFQLTLREKIVFKQLGMIFSPGAPERFACCLLTAQKGSDVGATHIFSQMFIRHHKTHFPYIPMHIMNLSDPHDCYKPSDACSRTFKKIVDKVGWDNVKNCEDFERIEDGLQEHMSEIVGELSEKEKTFYKLERDNHQIRKKLNILHECGDVEDVFDIKGMVGEVKKESVEIGPSEEVKNAWSKPKKWSK